MSERDTAVEAPGEEVHPPPDHDAPGQVDYPDPAFDEDQDEADVETPDDGEPDA